METFEFQWRGKKICDVDKPCNGTPVLPYAVRCQFVVIDPLFVERIYGKDQFTYDGIVLNLIGDPDYLDEPVCAKVLFAPEEEVRKTV